VGINKQKKRNSGGLTWGGVIVKNKEIFFVFFELLKNLP
jgi:hypothetical protein